MDQILSLKDAAELHNALHQNNKKIVVTGGCFDILHIGHISLLENAKEYGDSLVLLLESDETIAKSKGEGRPVHTQKQRADVLAAIKFVDFIILLPPHMTNQTYDQLVKALQPDIIATTKNDPGVTHKERQAQLVGAKLVFVNEPIQDISTSRIVSAIQKEL